MQETLEKKTEIFVEDRMHPRMEEALQSHACQTRVVKIGYAGWGYCPLLGDYGLHVEVPIPDGSKMFLFQDAKKIRKLMDCLGATDTRELVGKQVVVYFDPRFNNYNNPAGLSAPTELERYVSQVVKAEKRSADSE